MYINVNVNVHVNVIVCMYVCMYMCTHDVYTVLIISASGDFVGV